MTDTEVLERNAHIPTSEVEWDIAVTEQEIATMTREIAGFRLLGDRLSDMRADSRQRGIQERREFIEKLHRLLRLRGAEQGESVASTQ